MRGMRLSVPNNLNEMLAFAGFALVVLGSIGVRPFWPVWAIPAIGAFLGFYSVKDGKNFLIAGLALLAAKWGLNYVPFIGGFAREFATELVRLVAPAMLVVSIRSLYDQLK